MRKTVGFRRHLTRYLTKRQKGNMTDIMAAGICILAMTVLMLSYMENIAMIHQKTAVGQLARKYILRMETVGYLTERDNTLLCAELNGIGVSEIDLEGTTMGEVPYGEPITLQITGKLKGGYVFEERRVSTAKN